MKYRFGSGTVAIRYSLFANAIDCLKPFLATKVVANDGIQGALSHLSWDLMQVAEIADLEQEVAGMAISKWNLSRLVIVTDQIVENTIFHINIHRSGGRSEDRAERVDVRVSHLDFVGNTTQKRFVDQFGGLQIRREN